jgi:hypothetical protein|tara:strand:- start:5767 stop:5940 length:174 start_codon:yes stop_codon:yes gene_type:complete
MEDSMFVRIAWRQSKFPGADPRSLRRIAPVPRRGCDDLEIPVRDFTKMTKGLFDRQE